jgi:two-component system OmpR family sensor kinase
VALRRRTLRARLVTTTTLAALVTTAVLVVGVQLFLARVTARESLGALQDRVAAAATTVRGSRGHVRVLDVPSDSLDQNLWIYDLNGARIDGGAPSPVLARAVEALSHTTGERVVTVGGRYRLLARPVPPGGRGPAVTVVVAGVDLRPYESFERRGLWLSLVLGGFVVIAAAVASWVVATYSLRQVHRMAKRADDWREHDLTGRFALGPPHDELTELGQTLDRMLDRITQVILAERRLTDEVAHELRNPITVIRTEAQLALSRPDLSAQAEESWATVVDETTRMTRSVTTILEAARSAHDGDKTCTVAAVFEEVRRQAVTRDDIRVTVEPNNQLMRLSVPMDIAVTALKPLLDNAVRHARTAVTLTSRRRGSRVLLLIEDDGAGIGTDEAELVFRPGYTTSDNGAGLGLALARRLTSSIGGTVRAVPGDHGCFLADLPAA